MTEINTATHTLQEQETDDALANLDTATAAHLRSIKAKMEVKAQQGAEKWEAISARVREWIDEKDFNRWFSAVKPTLTANAEQPPHLRLAFPTGFMRNWADTHYGDYVRAAWRDVEPSGTLEFAIQPAEDAPPAKTAKAGKKAGKIIPFPVFPSATRPVVNKIARSALFAAIQGKDRELVKDVLVAVSGDTRVLLAGEQLNRFCHCCARSNSTPGR